MSAPLTFPNLHRGESDVLALALEFDAPALLDDLRARRVAKRRQVRVIGTLGALGVAKRLGLIPAVRPITEALESSGYWLGPKVLNGFLHAIGE